MANENDNLKPVENESQIVLYQPNESIRLEVKLDAETVWLTQAQMVELFQTTKQNVSLHISNIFKEGELQPEVVVKDSLTTTQHGAILGKVQHKKVKLYNLDVIISVGYRVKSQRGTQFRQWATSVFEGDFYTARVALENLVRMANRRVVIVDAYVSALTLGILNARKADVKAVVYTKGVGQGMQRLMDEHDRLFPESHIDIRKWRKESHDRWLVIDDQLYHCGHSLNANGGHKISAITLMGISPEVILDVVE